ncbi:MAG: hypothetical protein ISR62_01335 [Desulfobacteraceae bacterium]|nr:hypothetical protein [Desulfobacterales bacterium]MBL6967050.1 hypothetical protein [Desulfobacteraceae bacterium]MBL7171685.1 hypothetical protein [Desulfobacteraceae bacterium]
MKKFLIIMVALFVSFAFVTGVMAEEKKAAVKTEAVKTMTAKGTVKAYEKDATLTVKVSKKTDLAFKIGEKADVQGDVKVGAKVSVTYNKDKDGKDNIATSIIAMEKKETKKAKSKK